MNWRDLNARLPRMTEDEVAEMLRDEMNGPRRATYLVRLHQRFTTLRKVRERREMLVNATDTLPG
jgi:hypothetical protein